MCTVDLVRGNIWVLGSVARQDLKIHSCL